MKVAFHAEFHRVYSHDPAAERGRLVPAEKALRKAGHVFVEPEPAARDLIELVHRPHHVDRILGKRKIGRMARLSAGGAVTAARMGMREPAFGLIRPPGHHASADSCWGFCFFNNMAIAVATLLEEGAVGSAVILDIDEHFGDGTESLFREDERVTYLHPEGPSSRSWLEDCRDDLDRAPPSDIIAVSAGFDRHIEDWGGTLFTDDYRTVGRWVREWSESHCGGRRFGALEGGYNPRAMAESLVALLDGMGSG